MATTGRNHLTSSHDRSPFISERRRKLFPIDDHDVDSELGHISPLCSDSGSDIEGVNSITDYDFTDNVQKERVRGDETPVSVKACSESMSPLTLSPYVTTFFRDTPRKYSPSQNLKTPHDTSTKPMLQKEQKALLAESKSLKRKSSPGSSPNNLKMDYKNSKVRTALFPPEEDIYTALPTKSFYSKDREDVAKRSCNRDKYISKHVKLIIGRHGSKHRKKFGQINNGVGHKIRKPKQRQISKNVLEKAAKKMLETGSVLNEYMQDLKELRNKQHIEKRIETPAAPQDHVTTIKPAVTPKIDEYANVTKTLQTTKTITTAPVKQIHTFPEENKENHSESRSGSDNALTLSSPKDTKSRKFFKSSRAKPTINQERTKSLTSKFSNDKNGSDVSNDRPQGIAEFPENNSQSQKINNESQDISNILINDDFVYEDMGPEADIDNILSVLSENSPQKPILGQNKYVESVGSVSILSQPNSDAFKSANGMTSQNTENHVMVEASVDLSNCLNPLNHVLQDNTYELVEISSYRLDTDCRTIFNTTEMNFEASVLTGSQYIDSKNDNGPNSFVTLSNTECLTAVDTRTDCQSIDNVNLNSFLTKESIHIPSPVVGTMYNVEPCLASSHVVFDNMLLEDSTTVTSLPKQNGSISHIRTGINQVLDGSNKITLEAYNSVLASENSIQLHRSNVANALLSPISQMCDVTSGLALNSPKRGRTFGPFLSSTSRASKILSFTNCNSVDMERQQQQQQHKLFPVFYPGAKGAPERGEKRDRGEVLKRSAKKFKALPEDQMLLDAGQKKFGYTICSGCNIVYHMGDPGDEIEHMNYHNASNILRFSGWKNEHLMADFQKNGRIIRVLPTDSKIWLKKVKDLMEFVMRELGCYEMEIDLSSSQVFLYIKNRTIAGCAVAAVPKGSGHRMLSSLGGVAMCSEESYPIKCGISHIWVAANFRKQRVATSLMDTVKNNFIYGYILTDNDIALTSPTEEGSAFAERYFKTPSYLVYYT